LNAKIRSGDSGLMSYTGRKHRFGKKGYSSNVGLLLFFVIYFIYKTVGFSHGLIRSKMNVASIEQKVKTSQLPCVLFHIVIIFSEVIVPYL
jgi:hypothetical protein